MSIEEKTKQSAPPRDHFIRFAWFNFGYLIFVILWGAWVRISKSGAGCGNHWPTCNGDVIPLSPSIKTLTEFTHRLSSGLSLPLALVLIYWAFKRFPKGHLVRWASIGSLVFLLSESALGAGLVKFELVADNASLARAITASLHLINTFTLSGFAFLTAWWAKYPSQIKWKHTQPMQWLLLGGVIAIILSSMSGAVTALGDTLFPTSIFTEGGLFVKLQNDLSSTTHFLVQLRLIHPVLAVSTAFYLFFLSFKVRETPLPKQVNRISLGLTGLAVVQLGAGMLNILLGAPAWLQLTHLLLASLVWACTLGVWVNQLEAGSPE